MLAFLHDAMYLLAMHLLLCFFSQCNMVVGNGHVLELFFTIKEMLACARFASWCNVVIGNPLVLVLEGKLEHARFSS